MADSVVDIDSLNDAQREAVLDCEGPLLVLAGAGSGKTRVLTYRIAHMIGDLGYRPWQILAITFTNKAAAEMRERLGALLPGGTRGMWVCTFHAMCVRILRQDGERLGYGPNFTIYDDDDSKRLVKAIMGDLNIDPKRFPLNMIRSKISAAKNAMVTPDDMRQDADDPAVAKAALVYEELQRRLLAANAMDFDDLLVNALELLTKFSDVLEGYQDRFLQISVDEYQDTNHVQYLITKLLAAKHQNLMVVGDDDQSIYSWRGADIQNILDFEKDYPAAHVVKLQQNYRSSGHILAAANAVVAHNSKRKPKKLFTNLGDGELVQVYQAANESDEGTWIAAQIEKLHGKGTSYDDMAVFYRTNAQSRIIEDMFLRAGVPYKIVGGTRFFDRAEIRDVTSYLKLVLNPADDVAARRIVNVPRRGIGATSQDKIGAYAAAHRLSFFEAAQACVAEEGLLTPRVRNALASWTSTIEQARHYTGELSRVIEAIVDKSGLISALEAEHTPEAQGRVENIREFMLIAQEFDESHEDVVSALETIEELRDSGILAEEDLPTLAATAPEGTLFSAAEASSQGVLPGIPAGAQAPGVAGAFLEERFEPVACAQLPAFMEWLALRSDLDSLAGQNSAVTLMTIHSAKGLEFPVVFVAGMEENLFPNLTFENDPARLEEERRLAYVAITRARQRLFLTYAATRRTYGATQANPRSRFINEIPPEHLKATGVGSAGFSGTGWEKRGDRHGTFGAGRGSEMYGGTVFGNRTRSAGGASGPAPVAKPRRDPKAAAESFAVGDRVSHKTFGVGEVLSAKGDVIEVRFAKSGQVKKLMKGFAPIVKVE
ncbi:MAG: UvrD-helicase domain-containing protein [Atopobiaceae bacterium]|jgi:DNA helicase-2/ATP-dependent DNA helicase PcrA|uniref:DNA 3'-5' helicase n=1 Tax=Muricaecibacterium torontonense TaxID=3032871 RepID=A0A4S2F2Q1_9ACTN|nr:UvrD-helicase domain-containing protein [Muricaecibacterium torontonense]MCI8675143.1 UvrD-helicase domain-containing protein [Atopobiaceae bacterium]TGY63229.1 DNA helicase UvrD [Muricaecibacterium torontonense]